VHITATTQRPAIGSLTIGNLLRLPVCTEIFGLLECDVTLCFVITRGWLNRSHDAP
jgi:hypothetical protein